MLKHIHKIAFIVHDTQTYPPTKPALEFVITSTNDLRQLTRAKKRHHRQAAPSACHFLPNGHKLTEELLTLSSLIIADIVAPEKKKLLLIIATVIMDKVYPVGRKVCVIYFMPL
ncbi:hypothetical protein BU24DRAFT_481007 [Aaosphaeria arxii CBS 175.79]|uniref:Uncharacterized protein n=1 Tax=Aaosphaeria arxii CBS 175.79 TaxID=1450172 RepID=A0A6A5XTX3_9PLEO|nr:uncharacterized protein BU24DRAFT_481007 [Aaosphaeria arxii CBS 175.79]KAF2016403.1 hypothetical protein BU24DRAFT_481007 [Aaosphaeria arxii CBS 175.79]